MSRYYQQKRHVCFCFVGDGLPDVFSEFNGHYCGGEFNGDGPLNREVMAYRIFERVGHEYHIICPVGNSH